ncbi:MAG: radical SAM protein [Nitrospirae bacterium]|nr:MAG: radical SAM protein [Nitrospirota bacterium]
MQALEPPKKLFVEVTTRCNLNCRMCVKQTSNGGITEGDMEEETFLRLSPLFPHLQRVVLNGIGEPLLFGNLERFIRILRDTAKPDLSIGFQTNGMLLNKGRAVSLLDAGLNRICISLDSTSQGLFRMIRKGGDLSVVKRAFDNLHYAIDRTGNDSFEIGIEFVLMRENLKELLPTLRWAKGQGVSFVIVTQVMPYDKGTVSQAVYDTNTQTAIDLYKKYSAQAEARGLNIKDYPKVYMKFFKDQNEMALCQLVERMRKEATSLGIVLHMENLLSRDERWFEHAQAILDEAREFARENQIDITLPELAPKNTRRCEFVEADSIFVSYNGEIHPCYFLWHKYSCYIGGIEKRVKPWVFGNVKDRDVLEIWNSEEFVSFRQTVKGYEFPFCFDCGFALCNYIQGEDFLQDCYTLKVPCGACLWCTGLFHCLQ